MRSTITQQTDVSIWLESNGVCLYVNDDGYEEFANYMQMKCFLVDMISESV